MAKKLLDLVAVLAIIAMIYGLVIFVSMQDKTYFVHTVWPNGPVVKILDYKGQEVKNIDLTKVKYETVWVAPEHLKK
jgi:hypothetical protein